MHTHKPCDRVTNNPILVREQVYTEVYNLLLAGWESHALALRYRCLYLFTKVMVLPEFEKSAPEAVPSSAVLEMLFDQLAGKCPTELEHPFLRQILYWVYVVHGLQFCHCVYCRLALHGLAMIFISCVCCFNFWRTNSWLAMVITSVSF